MFNSDLEFQGILKFPESAPAMLISALGSCQCPYWLKAKTYVIPIPSQSFTAVLLLNISSTGLSAYSSHNYFYNIPCLNHPMVPWCSRGSSTFLARNPWNLPFSKYSVYFVVSLSSSCAQDIFLLFGKLFLFFQIKLKCPVHSKDFSGQIVSWAEVLEPLSFLLSFFYVDGRCAWHITSAQ